MVFLERMLSSASITKLDPVSGLNYYALQYDGIRRQPLRGDRKKQAAVIAARSCQPMRGQAETDASLST